MRSLRQSLVLVLVLLATSTARAAVADFSGIELFVPVASRVPGANSTQWRTDLVITNRSEFEATTARVLYDVSGAGVQQALFELPARGSVTLTDVILTTFGRAQSFGTIWIGSDNDDARITAYARIYNSGNAAGEFGQLIQAMPLDQLGKRIWINGVTGIHGNRANVGVANPNNELAKFTLEWYDKSGTLQGGRLTVEIQPWEVVLLNDIFGLLKGAADEGVSILIESNLPLYAYASIVRNDTGDAYTIQGNGADIP